MKPDSPQFGPQLDPVDGTIGKDIQLVTRYVLASGPPGAVRMWSARQGRCTFPTKSAAVTALCAIKKTNTNRNLVPDDLRATAWWCYPGHHDPVCPVARKRKEVAPLRDWNPDTFHYRNEMSLRNGSFHRKTKKRGEYACYMNGDFMHFTQELPSDCVLHCDRKEADRHLPPCNRA